MNATEGAQATKAMSPKWVWVALAFIAIVDLAFLATILIERSYPCDFEVYRLAGESILNQTGIYTTLTSDCQLKFTYTPFAALLFVPFALLGKTGFAVWTLLGAVALWRSISLILKVNPIPVRWLSPAQQIPMVFLLVLPLEPFVKTLWYGQVNLFILWLVTESYFGTNNRRFGFFSAIATAIKVTAGLFTVFLILVRGTRIAWVVLATFAATVFLGFGFQRDQAWDYWFKHILSTDRVGPAEYIYNQSINGSLWRLLGEGGSLILRAPLSAVVLGVGFWCAKRLWTTNQQLWAVSIIGLVTLLVSPITWSHHYVVLLFPMLALAKDARTHLSSRLILLASYSLLLLANLSFKVIPHGRHLEFSLNAWQEVVANQYVILAILFLGFALNQTRIKSEVNN